MVGGAPAVDRRFLVEVLSDLVRADSVNPTLVPGGAGEARVAARVAERMRALGMEVELREAAPGRPSVVGRLPGDRFGAQIESPAGAGIG